MGSPVQSSPVSLRTTTILSVSSLMLLYGSSHHGLLADLSVFDPGSNLLARLINSSPCSPTQLWRLTTIKRSIRTVIAPARRQTGSDKTILIETKGDFERLVCGIKYTHAAWTKSGLLLRPCRRRDQTRPSSPDSNLWRILNLENVGPHRTILD